MTNRKNRKIKLFFGADPELNQGPKDLKSFILPLDHDDFTQEDTVFVLYKLLHLCCYF